MATTPIPASGLSDAPYIGGMRKTFKFLAPVLAALVLASGCSVTEITPTTDKVGTPSALQSEQKPLEGTDTPVAGMSVAMQKLETLQVKGKAPMTGYDRNLFGPAWKDVDRNGCDTRNDILARDLGKIVHKPGTYGCVIASGTLDDPYTGKQIDFVRGSQSSKVQIDHVVALGNVWVSGGQKLSPDKKEAIANDPLNLLAVDGPANMQKGDKDASGWLPKNKQYRCKYIARQIAVKSKYGLSVTPSEKQAMKRVLDTCPGQGIPQK